MTQAEAMLLSMASEAVVAAAICAVAWPRAAIWAVAAAVLGTALTHPLVWNGAYTLFPYFNYWTVLAIVEMIPLFGETVVYRVLTRLSWTACFGLSFCANAASVALGLWLQS